MDELNLNFEENLNTLYVDIKQVLIVYGLVKLDYLNTLYVDIKLFNRWCYFK